MKKSVLLAILLVMPIVQACSNVTTSVSLLGTESQNLLLNTQVGIDVVLKSKSECKLNEIFIKTKKDPKLSTNPEKIYNLTITPEGKRILFKANSEKEASFTYSVKADNKTLSKNYNLNYYHPSNIFVNMSEVVLVSKDYPSTLKIFFKNSLDEYITSSYYFEIPENLKVEKGDVDGKVFVPGKEKTVLELVLYSDEDKQNESVSFYLGGLLKQDSEISYCQNASFPCNGECRKNGVCCSGTWYPEKKDCETDALSSKEDKKEVREGMLSEDKNYSQIDGQSKYENNTDFKSENGTIANQKNIKEDTRDNNKTNQTKGYYFFAVLFIVILIYLLWKKVL